MLKRIGNALWMCCVTVILLAWLLLAKLKIVDEPRITG